MSLSPKILRGAAAQAIASWQPGEGPVAANMASARHPEPALASGSGRGFEAGLGWGAAPASASPGGEVATLTTPPSAFSLDNVPVAPAAPLAPRPWCPAEIQRLVDPVEVEAPDFDEMRERILTETLSLAKLQAQEQTEHLLGAAQAQADEILAKARAEAGEVTRQAYREGMAAAQAEATELLTLARKIVDEVRGWRTAMFAQSEADVLALVQTMAQQVFGAGLVLDADVLSQTFERALAEAKSLGDLRIRAHPEDVALLGPLWPTQQTALTGQSVELVPNRDVARGGCYIEGQFGSVDGRVATQMRLVTQSLDEVTAQDALAAGPFTTYSDEGSD
jgi:flagellar assembly protein FliH